MSQGHQSSFLTSGGAVDLARVQRDAGMQAALEHAEDETASWGAIALEFLRRYALREEAFAGFLVVMASELDKDFPRPPNAKAWGQVFRTANKNGWIENSGRTTPHPKRHACPAIVWRSLIYRPAS